MQCQRSSDDRSVAYVAELILLRETRMDLTRSVGRAHSELSSRLRLLLAESHRVGNEQQNVAHFVQIMI